MKTANVTGRRRNWNWTVNVRKACANLITSEMKKKKKKISKAKKSFCWWKKKCSSHWPAQVHHLHLRLLKPSVFKFSRRLNEATEQKKLNPGRHLCGKKCHLNNGLLFKVATIWKGMRSMYVFSCPLTVRLSFLVITTQWFSVGVHEISTFVMNSKPIICWTACCTDDCY